MSGSSSSAVSTTDKNQQFGCKEWCELDLIGEQNQRANKKE